MKTPSNDYEALEMGLTLAITAPEGRRADEVLEIVKAVASRLSESDIMRAKRAALVALYPHTGEG